MMPTSDDFEVVVAAVEYAPSALEETLRSIVSAVPRRTRITVIDDTVMEGSLEDTAHMFFPRVAYHRNVRPLGLAGTLNKGFALSTSRYTVFPRVGDTFLPDAGMVYRLAVEEHEGAAVIFPRVVTVSAQGDRRVTIGDKAKGIVSPAWGNHSGKKAVESLLATAWAYPPAAAWLTELADEFPFDSAYGTATGFHRLLRLLFEGEHLTAVGMEATTRNAGQLDVPAFGNHKDDETAVYVWAGGEAKKRRWFYTEQLAKVAVPARASIIARAFAKNGQSFTSRARAAGDTFRPIATLGKEQRPQKPC